MPPLCCTTMPTRHSPSSPDTAAHEPPQAQKQRRGLQRLRHALGYSLAGLRVGWHEPAFRQETLAALVLLPLAVWLGQSWVETALLAGAVVLVLVVELLNTGIEAAIDRIGPEWHFFSTCHSLQNGQGAAECGPPVRTG